MNAFVSLKTKMENFEILKFPMMQNDWDCFFKYSQNTAGLKL